MDAAFCFIRKSAKAVAGFFAAAVAGYLTRKGFDFGPEVEVGIAAFVAALVVYVVPNRSC